MKSGWCYPTNRLISRTERDRSVTVFLIGHVTFPIPVVDQSLSHPGKQATGVVRMDYKERYSSLYPFWRLIFVRLSHFRRIVNSSEVETVDLHRLASLTLRGPSPLIVSSWRVGIPDENSLRPRIWKLLFRILPPEKSDWQSILYQKRCQYYVAFSSWRDNE